jgi:hypothetical protein
MVVEQLVEWMSGSETEVHGEYQPQWNSVHPSLTWARTRTAAMGNRRVTAWATARPTMLLNHIILSSLDEDTFQWNSGYPGTAEEAVVRECQKGVIVYIREQQTNKQTNKLRGP